MSQFNLPQCPTICVVGLGYVGLPLALAFSRRFCVIGFDISESRVTELSNDHDSTCECSPEELQRAKNISFTSDVSALADADVFIVTVPTPVDSNNQPDMTPLKRASESLAPQLRKNVVVVYESTVYPGATEEVCIPILEAGSGLLLNVDFGVGYSPERINPGDKTRRVTDIMKVTSGSSEVISKYVDQLYASIITAGTHRAPSIKVAEAAKVIENVQRDVNIALINELHQIFTKLQIDSEAVVAAASTKWNFMKLTPGMVGGHCIGIDPYYLINKSLNAGYVPDLIRKAREINNSMSTFYANDLLRKMLSANINPIQSKVLILGVSFKANCPDYRNTKVVEFARELQSIGLAVHIFDPLVDREHFEAEYEFPLLSEIEESYDVVVKAVHHDCFKDLGKAITYSLAYRI